MSLWTAEHPTSLPAAVSEGYTYAVGSELCLVSDYMSPHVKFLSFMQRRHRDLTTI